MCAFVCVWVWTLLLPDADIAVKHLQRCHLAPHIKETKHSDCVKSMDHFTLLAELDLSHHHRLFDIHHSQNANQLKTFFPLWEKHTSRKQKSGVSNQQTYMRSLCLPNWFQLLLPHHWHRNKWAVFYQSWNVQTCEFNQVHRRLWLETHAAFLSYDLITRLFSPRVKGVGLTRLYIVLSYTFEKDKVSSVVCFISRLMCSVWQWTWDVLVA